MRVAPLIERLVLLPVHSCINAVRILEYLQEPCYILRSFRISDSRIGSWHPLGPDQTHLLPVENKILSVRFKLPESNLLLIKVISRLPFGY